MKPSTNLIKAASDNQLDVNLLIEAAREAHNMMTEAGVELEFSERICLNVAYAYDIGPVLDIGSYVNIYPLALTLLGSNVTIVDYFPQLSPQSPYFNPAIPKAFDMLVMNNVTVINCDIYEFVSSPERSSGHYARITSFECFEHLWHSPRPIVEFARERLIEGGRFIVSVPNMASLRKRAKLLLGRSVLPEYRFFYHNGNPFTGHRREMTVGEVAYLLGQVGRDIKIDAFEFGGASYYQVLANHALPASFRGTIFGSCVKSQET